MGLDISYANNLTRVECVDQMDCDHLHVYNDSDFPDHAAPLEPGCYEADNGLEGGFRAGSYGGYNEWRDMLARLVGAASADAVFRNPSKYASFPFYELINFSDCEGVIGSTFAKKLAADFSLFDDAAKDAGNEWFYSLYQNWRRAFDAAAQDGVVLFH